MMSLPDQPPVLTVPIVRAHRRALEAALVELRAAVPAAALAVARNEPAAAKALVALRRQIADAEFEIAANCDAAELAATLDHAAQAAHRAAIQTLPAEQIISGIGKDSCCSNCQRGTVDGCVIAGGSQTAECLHPVTQRDLYHRDATGRWIFPCRANPQASTVFDAVLARLKLQKDRFA